MATTLKAFLKLTTAGNLLALTAPLVGQLVGGSAGTRVDQVTVDFATDSYAKHGAAAVTLTGTTPVTLDLTDLTSNATSYAGDTTFATWNRLVLNNTGAADVTVAVGASNPARLLLAGTTPTLTIPANSAIPLASAAGLAVDGTHKTITITPTAGGSFVLGVAGA